MCDECSPQTPEAKAVYEELETVIKKVLELEGRTQDIMTEWVLVTAQTKLGAHNDSYAVGWTSPWGQALWKTKGMLHEVLDDFVAQDVAMRITQD